MSLKTLSLGGVEFIETPDTAQYVTVRTGPGENDWANVLLGDFRSYMTADVNTRLDALTAEVEGNVGPSIWPAARTLTLTGVMGGAVSFDGSADFSLDTTIADGALTISKVADLSNQLAAKLDATANAVSAGKLSPGRTIAIAGIVSGNEFFDGTANITITTVMADGTLSIAKTSGLQAALDGKANLSSADFTGIVTVRSGRLEVWAPDNNTNPIVGLRRSGQLHGALLWDGLNNAVALRRIADDGFNTQGELLLYGDEARFNNNMLYHTGNLNPSILGYLAIQADQYNANANLNVDTLGAGSKVMVNSTGNPNVPSTSSTFWYIETLQTGNVSSTLLQRAYGTSNDEVYIRRGSAGAWSSWRRQWNAANFDPTSKLDSNAVAASAAKLQTARRIYLQGLVSGFADFDGTADINITTAIADNTLTIAQTSGLQSALDSKAAKNSPTLTGTVTLAGDMVPDADNIRSLGTPSLMWKDVYIGPGSLYINGQKVLQETAGTIQMTADPGQNISVQTTGTGDIELAPQGTGVIQLKGPISFLGGSKIRSSNGTALLFDDDLQFSAGVGFVGPVTINGYTVWNANNQFALGATQADARTALGLSPLAYLAASDDTQLLRGDGVFANSLNGDFALTAATGPRSMNIGSGRTGDGDAFIDLVGDTTYPDYGLRMQRGGGSTAPSFLTHRGPGPFYLDSQDNGPMHFRIGGVTRLGVLGNGNLLGALQRDVLPNTGASPAWVKIGTQTWSSVSARVLQFELANGDSTQTRLGRDYVTVSCRGIANTTTVLTQALVDQMVDHVRMSLEDTFSGGAQVGLVLVPDGAGGFTGIDIYVKLGSNNVGMPFYLRCDVSSGFSRDFNALTSEPAGIVYATIRKVVTDDGAGTITASHFAGNADTASKLQSSQTVKLAGIVSSDTVDFDGSGGIVLTTAVADNALTIAKTSGLQAALDGKAPLVHTHAIADVTGLQSALDGKLGATATATAATKLATPRTIGLSGVSSTPQSFDGTGNVTIEVIAVPTSLLSGRLSPTQLPALLGDVTSSAGSATTTIANGAVTFAKMAVLPAGRLIGRSTAGTGAPEAISIGSGLTLASGVLDAVTYGTSNPAYYNGTSGLDCNTLAIGSTALVSGANVNAPSGAGNSFWYIETLNSYTGAQKIQRAFGYSTGEMMTRAIDAGGVWSAWTAAGSGGGGSVDGLDIAPNSITVPNGQGMTSVAGAAILTGAGGGTWSVQRAASNNAYFALADELGNNQWTWDASGSLTTANSISMTNGSISFGSSIRQMINLYGSSYAIGIQNNTLYHRTGNGVRWYTGGAHATNEGDPGTGGVEMMSLNGGANAMLTVGGVATIYKSASGEAHFGSTFDQWYLFFNGANMGFYSTDGTGYALQIAKATQAVTAYGPLSSNTRIFTGYDSGVAGSVSCSQWFRSNGATGWYNSTYGGGWFMQDTTYVRSYQNKAVVASDFVISSDETLKAGIRPFEWRGRLEPINYTLRDSGEESFGFSAQKVKELYPEAVPTPGFDGTLKLSYHKLTAVLAYQANRTEDRVEVLDGQMATLEQNVADLKSETQALHQELKNLTEQYATQTQDVTDLRNELAQLKEMVLAITGA